VAWLGLWSRSSKIELMMNEDNLNVDELRLLRYQAD
jgi:hypothetical protein